MTTPAAFVLLFVLGAACGSRGVAPRAGCYAVPNGCVCDYSLTNTQDRLTACNPAVLPDSMCCVEGGWPSSGDCSCLTNAVYCGVVPHYFPAQGPTPAQDGCVCSRDPAVGAQQSVGATCYPGATTASTPALGICCTFPADAPGAVGEAACICEAGAHTCGAGGTPVGSCSAADLPPAPTTCGGGATQVATCL